MVVAIDGCASQTQDFAERITQGIKSLIGEGAVVVAGVVIGDIAVQGDALVQAFAVIAETQQVFVVGEAGVELHAELDFVVFHQVFHLGAEEDVEP